VVIGDGAKWIWALVAEHFPDAMQIVDLYYARQHLREVARQLYPHEEIKQKAWMKVHQKRLLDKGKIERLVGAQRAVETTNSRMAQKLRTEADYFERNAERMRYPKFRRQHLFVGSGVIEAGCKTVTTLLGRALALQDALQAGPAGPAKGGERGRKRGTKGLLRNKVYK